jgi:hypothetical protein
MTSAKFFFKWILPIAIPVFVYFSIGSFMDSGLDKSDLKKVKSRIVKIEYYESSSRGGSNTNMRLHLSNGNTYKIPSEWEGKFNQIEDEYQKSDEIELFHRNKNQTKWRLGTADIVYHLMIGDTIIIDINERKSKSKMLGLFTGFVALFGLIVLIVRRRRLMKNIEVKSYT